MEGHRNEKSISLGCSSFPFWQPPSCLRPARAAAAIAAQLPQATARKHPRFPTTAPRRTLQPPSADQPYDLPIVTDGSVTISISSPDCKVKGYSYTDGLPVWTKLEEETGIKIDWRVTPPAATMIPSSRPSWLPASTLPISSMFPDGSPMKYVNDGLIVPHHRAVGEVRVLH